MNMITTSIMITLSAVICVVCVYGYLYLQYRHRYLALWMISWLIYLVRLFFQHVSYPELSLMAALGFAFLITISTFILLCGTVEFLETNLHQAWWFITAVTIIVSSITIMTDWSFSLRALPACIYVGVVYFWTGLLFLRQVTIPGWGKHITGGAFILLGIHIMDLPFLIEVTWFAPWGFMLDAALRFIIAIGTLIVYFEKTRQDLQLKEQHYRLFAENAIDVIYRYRLLPLPGFEYISPSVNKLTGYSPEEFYSVTNIIHTIVYPDDWPLFELFMANASAAAQPLTLRFIHRDQTVVWIEQTSAPIFDQEGLCVGFEGIIRDISARKALEQDVARLDRLNTVGQMAASMAHEIRNPMTTIRGYLQLFSNKKEFFHYQEQLCLLLDELDRTNSIIKEYLALSQHKMVDMKLTQLNSVIEALSPLLKADAVASCNELLLQLGNIPALYIDAQEIRQLLLNLVRNGLEAMTTGHAITIQTAMHNDAVDLTVTDQGPGMPQNVLDNLGQPFFTTKDTGTGLGLAICHRIANRHQAKIEVQTGSHGTTVTVRFKIPHELL